MDNNNAITWNERQWLEDFRLGDRDEKRELRKQVWENTLAIVKAGGYALADGRKVTLGNSDALDKRTCFYSTSFTPEFERVAGKPIITIVSDDCLDTAHKWVAEGLEVCVLNMASRRNPGGGVRNGAGAQEEYLFRCSNYYRSLFQFVPFAPDFGLRRARYRYPLDENYGGIYSPEVTIFRGSEERGYPLLKAPWRVNMVAVSGMNSPKLFKLNGKERIVAGLVEGVKNKMRTIFRIACKHGQRNLVLGALGCGAFHNPPEHVAELFRAVLAEQEFAGAFQRICFAIKSDSNSHGSANYDAFKKVFSANTQVRF